MVYLYFACKIGMLLNLIQNVIPSHLVAFTAIMSVSIYSIALGFSSSVCLLQCTCIFVGEYGNQSFRHIVPM